MSDVDYCNELFAECGRLKKANAELVADANNTRIVMNKLIKDKDALVEEVSLLRNANAELVAALREIKSGGGRAEILGLDKYRCPQCASTEIAEQALAKHGEK